MGWLTTFFPGKIWVYLAVCLGIFTAGAGSAWKVQSWRMASQEKDRVQLQLATEREWAKNNAAIKDRIITAQNAATARATVYRRDADSTRAGLNGLRDSAVSSLTAASKDLDACVAYGDTQSKLLLGMAEAGGRIAAEADLWVNDAQTLSEACGK